MLIRVVFVKHIAPRIPAVQNMIADAAYGSSRSSWHATEHTRSPYCVRTAEHEAYKHSLRGVGLEDFTRELHLWRPMRAGPAIGA